MRDLLSVLLAAVATLAACQQLAAQEDWCEEAAGVQGFTFAHGGSNYSVTAFVRLTRDDEVLFEDDEPRDLVTSYYSAAVAEFGPALLLIVSYTDCVDTLDRRLLVISPEGEVIHERVWTSHWEDGFLSDGGDLLYWSEWFCHNENPELSADSSYVYVLSAGEDRFKRREVGRNAYCERELRLLPFTEVEPVLKR